MKQIYRFLPIIILLLIISSCKNEIIMFDGSKTYVGFDQVSVIAEENINSTDVQVMIAGIEGNNSVTVDYVITTEGIANPAIENVDFTLSTSGSVTFPTGAGYSIITVHPINNDIFTGNKLFKIVVTANSANYPIGREKEVLITIKDDEHPLRAWIGNYIVEAASYGDPGNWDEIWSVTTEADPDNQDNLLITGVGGPDSGPIIAVLDKEEMTITIAPGQNLGDVYGYGNTGVYKGTDSGTDVIDDEPLFGIIEEDGTILIDLWGHRLDDGPYAGAIWDVFNTTWTKQ